MPIKKKASKKEAAEAAATNGSKAAGGESVNPSGQALQVVDVALGVADRGVTEIVEPAREKVEALLDEKRRSDELDSIRVTLAEEVDKASRRGAEVRERAQNEVAERLRGAADRLEPVTRPVEPIRQRVQPLVDRVRELV